MSDRINNSGMTVVEVMVALLLTGLLCVGVIALTRQVRRAAEHNRCATEARALGKERLEEILALGRPGLMQTNTVLMRPDTNTTTTGFQVTRRTRVVWHAVNGAITTALDSAYAEVHVDVGFWSPLRNRSVSNTFSMLVQ